MKLNQLLKLAEDFETAADSWQPDPSFDEAGYDAATAANEAFAEKKRKEVVSVVSSLIPSSMDFNVAIADKGPGSPPSVYCSIGVELGFSDLQEAKRTAKLIFENLKNSDDFEKLDKSNSWIHDEVIVVSFDFTKK